jgi:hypothetical protein
MNGQCRRSLRLVVSEIRGTEANDYCTDDNKDMKFVLLHEGKNDDGIRAFFTDVWELYVKVSGLCCWLMRTEGGYGVDDDEPVSYGAQHDRQCSV